MIAIYGAGKKGQIIAKRIRKDEIAYFVDRDENKVGKYICGIEVKSIDDFLNDDNRLTLVTTVNHPKVFKLNKKRMSKCGRGGTCVLFEDYFNDENILKAIDESLYSRFKYDSEIKDSIFYETPRNWYREMFCDEINEKLVRAMKAADTFEISKLFASFYCTETIYYDEYYEKRPGIRLIHRLFLEQAKKLKVIDLACGHGALISRLAEDGHDAYAIDCNKVRVEYIKSYGVKASLQDIAGTDFDNGFFDAVVCMECLEHVTDVISVKNEIERILKIGGIVFITVPYMKNCEWPEHVRQFDEVKLASLFSEKFEIVNMIRLPYLNWEGDNNLLYVGKKIIE